MADNLIKVLIADDHPVFRAGLSQILKHTEGIRLVGEASNGDELLAMIDRESPDVILTDIDMPKKSGFEVAEKLKMSQTSPRIIFLTLFEDEEFFNKALDLGVSGFLLKENAAVDIISAIRSVAAGKYFITPFVSDFMIRRSEGSKLLEGKFPEIKNLTAAERNVLSLISQGKTTREISEELFVSIKTTETHRSNISRKLNLSGSNALVKFALENKNLL